MSIETASARAVMRRFWKTAGGFWQGATAWALLALLVIGVVLQVFVQYRLNYWNRDFFNALEAREGGQIWHLAQVVFTGHSPDDSRCARREARAQCRSHGELIGMDTS